MAIPAVNPICSTHCSSKQKFKCAVAVEDPPTTPTKKNKNKKPSPKRNGDEISCVCGESELSPSGPVPLFSSSFLRFSLPFRRGSDIAALFASQISPFMLFPCMVGLNRAMLIACVVFPCYLLWIIFIFK